MLRLGIVAWSFSTVDGVGRCVVESATRLAEHYDVHVFVAETPQTTVSGVTLHQIPLRLTKRYPREVEYLMKLNRTIRQSSLDLVHCHIPAIVRADVLTCHSAASVLLQSKDIGWRVRVPYLIQDQLFKFHLRNNHTVISAVSHSLSDALTQCHQLKPERLAMIPNGVDLERFKPTNHQNQTIRSQLGWSASQFVFLLVGSSLRLKGAHHAAHVIARLPKHAVLLVVSNSGPHELPDNDQQIQQLQNSGRLRFVKPDHDLVDYYAASDALFFPSQYESFGLVVLEAMACGLPVLTCSTVGFAAQAIVDGDSGFLVSRPDDLAGLTQRAEQLVNSPERCKRMSARARAVAEQYSWQQHVVQTHAVYQRVLAKRARTKH